MTIRELLVGLGFQINEESERKAEQGISDLKDKATKLLGAIGIGFSLAQMNSLAEEFNGINDKINFAVKGLADQKDAQEAILKAANDTKSSYESMAGIVTNLIKSDSSLFPVEDAVEFSSAVTKLLKTAGRGDSEIQAMMEGLNKSFQKGTVTTETLNVMLARCPETANLLAERLGVAKTSLLDMASQGKISCQQLKDAFIGSADEIDSAFNNLDFSISDALLNVRNKWGYFLDDFNVTFGITERIGRAIVKFSDLFISSAQKMKARLEWIADKLGGTEKLVKLIGITAAAAFGVMAIPKLIGFLDGIMKIDKSLLAAKLKMLAIIAVIVLLALLVEDFIKFLKGEDSLIGSLFDKAGIGAENARQTIFKVWETVSSFLRKTWDVIKGVALSIFGALQDWWEEHGEAVLKAFSMIWDAIKTMLAAAWTLIKNLAISIFGGLVRFWQQHGEQIKSAFTAAWNTIKTVLLTVWNVIKTVATTIFGGLLKFWEKHGEQIKTSFSNIWSGIQQIITSAWEAIKAIVQAACVIVGAIIKTVFGAIKAFWDTWGSTIIVYFSGVWETIKAVFSTALDVLADIFAIFSDLFSGNWSQLWEDVKTLISDVWNGIVNIVSTILEALWNIISSIFNTIWEGITTTVGNIRDSIVDGFQSAIDWITGLPAQALQWGADIIGGIVDGIKGAVGKVTDAVKGVADKIKSFLHFSVPDEGPLTDYQNWMPDFMGGLANGIEQSAPKVVSAAEALAGKLANSLNIEVPDNSSAVETLTSKLGNAVKDFAPKAALTLQSLTGDIGLIAQSAVASPKTAQTSVGGNTSKVITQNVNISNQFNGDRAGQQKSSEAMDKAADDSTEELARALKYAR